MQRIERELTKAGIPYVSECLGGDIEGLRVGSMYIIEHGSGQGYYFGNLEDESDTCRTVEEVLELAKQYKEGITMKTVEVVVIETGWSYLEWLGSFTMNLPEDEDQAVAEAIRAVEASGYRVIPNNKGGCNELNRVSYGKDYITVTVEPK